MYGRRFMRFNSYSNHDRLETNNSALFKYSDVKTFNSGNRLMALSKYKKNVFVNNFKLSRFIERLYV